MIPKVKDQEISLCALEGKIRAPHGNGETPRERGNTIGKKEESFPSVSPTKKDPCFERKKGAKGCRMSRGCWRGSRTYCIYWWGEDSAESSCIGMREEVNLCYGNEV